MLVTAGSTEGFAKRELGGKGYNLYLMSRSGLPVPEWVGVAARTFAQFRKITGIDAFIREILREAQHTRDFLHASQKIAALILSRALPAHIEEAAREAYRMLPEGLIAVRSSALDEDSSTLSFAGQLSTFLYVATEEDALRRLKECWASAYSERGLSYRHQNGVPLDRDIEVAVVFQRMIESERSGVLFTCDPINDDPTTMIVNSVYGVGEGLVSGLLDADAFWLQRKDGGIKEQTIVRKPSQLLQGASGETRQADVETALRDAPSLTSHELRALWKLGEKVDLFYRRPQDVEWGFADGRFYLLQSRPITTIKRDHRGALHIWDNSNIIESYGGITLPLTFTFASYVYREVYLQLCDILLVPKAEIAHMEHPLKNMLGSFYGRVYYNLLNWYKLLTIIPGFKQNRQFMETMMGVGEALSDEVALRCKPSATSGSLRNRAGRVVSGFKLFYYHFNAQKVVDGFLSEFRRVYDHFRRIDYGRMPGDEIYGHYIDLEKRLLRRWHAPIVNDMLCMIHFGLLKKLTAKWFPRQKESLQNDLLCGEGNIESAEPTKELIRMSGAVHADARLRALFEATPADDLLEALARSEHADFYARVLAYIENYGFRCMSEMKLEQRDLHQDPTFLFVCLKNYLRSGQIDLGAYEEREKAIRRNAEAIVAGTLSGWKKAVYGWSLRHARRAVRNRENTRFCRTRVYGVVRSMFYGMGADFTARGLVDDAGDVFHLTLQELHGCFDGTCTVQDLRKLIALRKAEYKAYEAHEPAPRFMTRGPVYWHNDHFGEDAAAPSSEGGADGELPSHCIKGTGCCPGVVEGVVKVILSPDDDLELNGEILVTQRTDPGWIPLYPSVSALLVERGGLLSHSAIVAREMGLPTIVGIPKLTERLKNGMRVRMDGATGVIEILEEGRNE